MSVVKERLPLFGNFISVQHYGEELREHVWTPKTLARQPGDDKMKAKMARILRVETTMVWEWIAKRLVMGHWRTAVNALRALAKESENER